MLPSIPGYVVLEELGRGGYGTVYRARQESLDRIVAIKVLSQDRANDADAKQQFLEEARTASKLHHTNVIQGIDVGECSGLWWFAMEFVAGQDLRRQLDERGPLPEGEVLEIAREVALALDHAHGHGLVHGDVKPENLMIAPDGTVKLFDFGISRVVRGRRRQKNPVPGTAGFVAPELLDGRSTGDSRSDLFGLGVTLFELITGKVPPPELGDPAAGPDVRKRRRGISPKTASVISNLLAPDPNLRYQTAGEFLEDLARVPVMRMRPLPGRPPALAPPNGKPSRFPWKLLRVELPGDPKRRAFVISAAAVGLAVVMLAVALAAC